jgi:uroporphyrinogen decarboxylase
MSGMTARERVLKTLKRKGIPDRVPFEISWGAFTPGLMQVFRNRTGSTESPDVYFDFDTRSVNLNPTRKSTSFKRFFDKGIEPDAIFDEWGVGAVRGSKEHFLKYKYHPLALCRNVAEVLDFEWPDVTADYRFDGMKDSIGRYRSQGYAVMGELYQTIFEMAWLLRGMEDFLTDFYLQEGLAHAICEKLTEMRIVQARKYASLGVDILRLGDDVCTQTGPMFSKEIYRTFFKERVRRIVQTAKEANPDILVFIHCDGKVESMVEEFIDIGIDVLNPVQSECNDLPSLKRAYGDRISFWGGIGTQSTMPFGSPQEVAAKVRELKDTLGRGGGLLLAPTHILEPEVPWENVIAFIEACRSARY